MNCVGDFVETRNDMGVIIKIEEDRFLMDNGVNEIWHNLSEIEVEK